jgi:hypothetical protein
MSTIALSEPIVAEEATSTAVRWRRIALGVTVTLHGLAHSSVIVWATDSAPFWIISLLWTVATIAYLGAGLGILNTPLLRATWPALLAAATFASLILLALTGTKLASLGILIDLMLIPGAVRWGPPADVPGRRHRVGNAFAFLFLGWTVLVVLNRPLLTQWGTTKAERAAPLFGDPGTIARYRLDHAVTIKAPADSAWRWLVQLGQDRAGFYSYDWLERLFGDNVHNVKSLRPEWQTLRQGDFVRAVQPTYLGGRFGDIGWRVSAIDPGRALVLENWGAFVLRPIDTLTTRFFIRTRGPGDATMASVLAGPLNLFVFEPAHFIMQRRMMLEIQRLAEQMMR